MQLGAPVLMGLCLMVNLKLFRFFDRLKKGHLFDEQTVRQLAAAGKWWIVLYAFDVFFYAFGHKFLQTPNEGNLFNGNLFAGLTLIFVAWLLREAQGLQEEQALTV